MLLTSFELKVFKTFLTDPDRHLAQSYFAQISNLSGRKIYLKYRFDYNRAASPPPASYDPVQRELLNNAFGSIANYFVAFDVNGGTDFGQTGTGKLSLVTPSANYGQGTKIIEIPENMSSIFILGPRLDQDEVFQGGMRVKGTVYLTQSEFDVSGEKLPDDYLIQPATIHINNGYRIVVKEQKCCNNVIDNEPLDTEQYIPVPPPLGRSILSLDPVSQ